MSDLDLIHHLGGLLGRPLEQISEDRFEQHIQAKFARHSADFINRDAYSLAEDGTISGLFLRWATSEILLDFPFQEFSQVGHLYLHRVNLQSFSFLSELKGLKSLDLSDNKISDCSFLSELKGLTWLDLRNNKIRVIVHF